MKYRLFVVAILAVAFSSCIRSTTSRKGRRIKYETFFVGDGVMQYYIPSVKLSDSKTESFFIDYTFRNNFTDTSIVICNFTLQSSKPIEAINKITFRAKDTTNFSYSPEKIYSEFRNKRHIYRYTIGVYAVDFKTLLSKNIDQIDINGSKILKMTSKGKRMLNNAYNDLVYYSLKDVTTK